MIPHSRPLIHKKDLSAVRQSLLSGQLAQGREVLRFERALASSVAVRGGVATSSGTAALHLALLAVGVGRGDEVIIPSYVCTALLNAVSYTRATPRLVDVNASDFNISVADVQRKMNRRTRAVIVPHMFGQPADMKELKKLGVPLIEDCAQAVGAGYFGRPVGSFGQVSVFSFYATKMLTSGEGGMALSREARALRAMRALRDYDEQDEWAVRFNYKMTEMQAALGLSQFFRLPAFIAKRRAIARVYTLAWQGRSCILPAVSPDKEHVFFRYVIRVRDARRFIRALDRKGISCRPPVYRPLHRYLGQKGFPVSEKLMTEAVSIPLYPSLSAEETGHIVRQVRSNS
jgi:dTDP-4-amino-4,6-dideoxygalactose transaminase